MITLTGAYALRGMAYMARLPAGEYVLATEVGKALEIPVNYLGKVLQALAKRGLLQSQRGRNGGFRLNRPAQKITLAEVLSAVEPVDRYSICILGHKTCSDQTACPIHATWKVARNQVIDLFQKTDLTMLVANPNAIKEPKASARKSGSAHKKK